MVGIVIGIIAILIFVISVPWLSAVFRGENILNQTIFSLKLDYLSIWGFKLPFTDLSLRFYSVFILLAFFAGYILSTFLVRKSFLPATLIDRLLIGIVLFGLLGSRLFFVLFNLDHYFGNAVDIGSFFQSVVSMFLVYEGGLSIIGGIIGAVLYLQWFARRHKFNLLEIMDVLAPGLLLGQVIGRLGNFFNYEAYGAPTNIYWKMFVPENAVNGNKYLYAEQFARYFHPTFLYEMIPNLILLVIILMQYTKLTTRNAGLVTALYLIGYGIIRFCTEFFRLDALKISFVLPFHVPNFLAEFIGAIFPAGVKEPIIYGLEHFEIQGIYTSQIAALILVIVGVRLYINRAGIIYSPATQEDLNAS